MLFWRCLVGLILFLLAVLVLSCSEMAKADAFFEQQQVDPGAKVFFLCVDKLQMEIILGLRPELDIEEAMTICNKRTASVLESLQQNGLQDNQQKDGLGL